MQNVTIDDVYWAFGRTYGLADQLQTHLATWAIEQDAVSLMAQRPVGPEDGVRVHAKYDGMTLGQLIKQLHAHPKFDAVKPLIGPAKGARDYIAHHFFRKHNFALHSPDGRRRMLEDINRQYSAIMAAYREAVLQDGIDIMAGQELEGLLAGAPRDERGNLVPFDGDPGRRGKPQ